MNLFERRATEYVKDEDSFLSLVTPDPIERFFVREAETLYVHPVWVLGNPGCGKTTVAQVFTLTSMVRLLRTPKVDAYRDLLAALGTCGAVIDGAPRVNGFRLAMESDYRALWELPYPERERNGLLTALVQARAILGWLRSIETAGVPLNEIRVDFDERAPAVAEYAGVASAASLRERARSVERTLYAITSALVPRPMTAAELETVSSYRPFDVLEGFALPAGWLGRSSCTRLKPLVMLDDVQRLHPSQSEHVREWIGRREMQVARWLLMWPDSVPADVGLSLARSVPGASTAREVTIVRIGGVPAQEERRAFDKAARDMAGRYLGRMHMFEVRRIRSLDELLSTKVDPPPARRVEQLRAENARVTAKLGLGSGQVAEIARAIAEYSAGTEDENLGEDVALAIEGILLARMSGSRQNQLFAPPASQEVVKQLKVDASVAEGARVRLAREFERPLYFGVAALTAAGTLNAELFLRLTSPLVDRSMTQITRRDAKALSPAVQDVLLREAAADVQRRWDFPNVGDVRCLVAGIAERCVDLSSRPNAPLGGGANAFGIPMEDYIGLQDSDAAPLVRLRRCLQTAVAHTAVVLSLDYSCKNKSWCLIELGGPAIMSNRLTLRRGGFVEGSVQMLSDFLPVPV